MAKRPVDITGLTVGYLTARHYLGSDGRRSLWSVDCHCGKQIVLGASELKKQHVRGITASCGCMRRATIAAKRTRHGMSHHPAFAVWRSMLDRCRLPSHQAWANYGGRGITVCKRWQSAFEKFWADMGPTYKAGLTLDRQDNEKGYSAKNCRWVTYTAQANNRRGNVRVGGLTVSQLAKNLGIGRSTIAYRLSAGVPLSRLGEKPDVSRRFTT